MNVRRGVKQSHAMLQEKCFTCCLSKCVRPALPSSLQLPCSPSLTPSGPLVSRRFSERDTVVIFNFFFYETFIFVSATPVVGSLSSGSIIIDVNLSAGME